MSLLQIFVRARGVSSLTDPEVAAALKISDTQKIRLADVQRANAQFLRTTIRQWARAGRIAGGVGKILDHLQREADSKVLKVLNRSQRDHFDQLRGL